MERRHTLVFARILLTLYLAGNLLLASQSLTAGIMGDGFVGHAFASGLRESKHNQQPSQQQQPPPLAHPLRKGEEEEDLQHAQALSSKHGEDAPLWSENNVPPPPLASKNCPSGGSPKGESSRPPPPSATSRQGGRAIPDPGLLLLNLLEEVPETAMLADVLNQMAAQTAIRPFVRVARTQELPDALTNSVYSTMLIVASFVFGIGSLVLAWKVFGSIREASKTEPVSFTFFLTLPGLRYLYNHIRYHLWEMPLQPRRRFASFIGHRGSKVDLSDLAPEGSRAAAIPSPNMTPHHVSSRLTRRDSAPKLHGPSTPLSTLSAAGEEDFDAAAMSPLFVLNDTQRHRRRSVAKKRTTPLADSSEPASLGVTSDRRHSVAVVQTPPSSTKSSERASPIPPGICPSARSRAPSSMIPLEEQVAAAAAVLGSDIDIHGHTSPSALLPDTVVGEEEVPVLVASPLPKSPVLLLSKLEDEMVPVYHPQEEDPGERRSSTEYALSTGGESTLTETTTIPESSGGDRSSVLSSHTDEYGVMRAWTPVSHEDHLYHPAAVSVEELNQRRADWVKSMSLFSSSDSAIPQRLMEERSAAYHHPVPLPESKLSRRLVAAAAANTANAPSATATSGSGAPTGGGLTHSKLSRYFALPPTTTSSPASESALAVPPRLRGGLASVDGADDSTSRKLYEGDLTPPPGFSRRHSSVQLVPERRGEGGESAPPPHLSRVGRFSSVVDATQIPPPQTLSRKPSGEHSERAPRRRQSEEGPEDTISPPPTYYQAFFESAFRRRSSMMAAGSTLLTGGEEKTAGYLHRRMDREGSARSVPLIPEALMEMEGEEEDYDDGRKLEEMRTHYGRAASSAVPWPPTHPPSRPHSAGLPRPALKVQIQEGGGSRSLGRVTPDDEFLREDEEEEEEPPQEGSEMPAYTHRSQSHHHLSLGIFDDILPTRPRRTQRSPSDHSFY